MSQMVAAAGACIPGESNPNLISNGSFKTELGNWYLFSTGTLAFVSSPSVSGESGALAFTPDVSDTTLTVRYRPGGSPEPAIPLNGLTTLDFVGSVRSANDGYIVSIVIKFWDNPYGLGSVVGQRLHDFDSVAAAGSFVELADRDVAVPVGATHVTLEVSFTTVTTTHPIYLDDVYLGPVDSDSPPYPFAATAAMPPNRLYNGDFEDAVTIWAGLWDSETLVRDTVAPITATASLKVTTPGVDANEGAFLKTSYQAATCIPGETLRLAFKAKGTGTIDAIAAFQTAVPAIVLTGTATEYAGNIVVPANQHFAEVTYQTTGTEAAEFWIDDVSLGTPP